MSNLQKRCPACNAEVAPMALYCGKCGERLGADPPPPQHQGYSNPQYAAPYAVAPKPKGINPACIVGCVLAAVIPAILLLLAIALPNFIKVKDKAKEAEVKANLHNIQLAVEKFAVDHDGLFPNYLIGGEAKFAAQVKDNGDFLAAIDCQPERVSDPLLRLGYLDVYPTNPFTRNGYSIHQMQDFDNFDPLRNGADSKGALYGTRYGADCTTMGNVLAEMRFKFRGADSDPSVATFPTYSNIVHPFWDMWTSNRPMPFLPGQFFYKSNGHMQPEFQEGTDELLGDIFPPREIDQYMLGGYGSVRTKGKDVLGEEQIIYFWSNAKKMKFEIASWTRSDNRGLGGSPYSPGTEGTSDQLMYGNPNGIRDSLILILTAGEDYIGDR